jgi:aryl-alcohol dehydrogenase-like predicted oxidoreductase
VRYIGCSNFSGWQVADAAWIARSEHGAQFISAQNEYNLLNRNIERELVPACNRFGLGVLPYFPLANGFLTGKYRAGEAPAADTRLGLQAQRGGTERILNDANFAKLAKLEEFAEGAGHSMLDLAIGWLASQPHVGSVIAGATKPEQIEQNVRAAEWKLSGEERAEVDKLTR